MDVSTIRVYSKKNEKGELVLQVAGIPLGTGHAMRETAYRVVDGLVGERVSETWYFVRDCCARQTNPGWLDDWFKAYLNTKIQTWFEQEAVK